MSGSNTFLIKSGAEYKLVNPSGGKALDMNGAGIADGTWTRMWDDTDGGVPGGTAQFWFMYRLD
ncbi:hypothetical protein ASG89_09720 [Paenibacillus sp. Soil766]|uniref:RICIN domain-containing protein n=1 Tax=Paenibacillus sp. Soil766 TaxID=1736404 RepID=UPI00070B6984|nr:RICIN domain-containing protein [Paenibacillus sp. Soil766]KRE86295.1 hypothetical protein ASG89_09720 [Paenibacillus sp. Soil766]